jgi:hypothetical protein
MLPAAPALDVTATLPLNGIPGSIGTAVQVPGYEILGKLGEGGMAVVYKARHLRLGHIVALKMILADGHARAADLARCQEPKVQNEDVLRGCIRQSPWGTDELRFTWAFHHARKRTPNLL